MAAFVTPHIPGFAPGDPVPSAAMNLINTQLPKAPNWVDGGAEYNPTDQLVMGGAGMRWTGPTEFGSLSETEFESGATVTLNGALYIDGPGAAYLRTSGRIVVQSTGEIAVQTGGDLVIESGGQLTWESGSLSQADSGATVQFASGSVLNVGGTLNFGGASEIFGTLTVNSAASVTVDGTFTLGNNRNVALSPARSWTRRNLRMCATASPSNVTESGSDIIGSGGNFIPSLKIESTAALSPFATLLEIDDLPHGQTITSVVVRTTGQGASPGASIDRAATYRVIRWTDETTLDAMSSTVSDSHTVGNWQTKIDQTITITSNSTIDRAYRYAVQVINHTAANSDPMHIVSVVATGTATSLRV